MNTSSAPESPPVMDQARWFAEQVHPHDSSLRAYLRGSFPKVRDVDDVVQESYLRVWRSRCAREIGCGRAFLFRVARNLALNLLQRDRIVPVDTATDPAVLSLVDEQPGPAERACVEESTRQLAAAIDALPPRCREIVILRRIHLLSQKEIALRLGISEQTVEQQVARGVKRCGEYLARRGVVRS
jgi:RNA polymerase sigma-70 factor (ECF subfamily)